MPSKKPTPLCDELKKAFDAFMAKPPTSNVHWDGMFATIERSLTEAKNAAADAECITQLKAEARRAREAWNEGQNTR